MAIYDEAAGYEDSPELLEYMRAIEEFEEIINTARIACIFTKRRYNVNYANSVTHPWEREDDLNQERQGSDEEERGGATPSYSPLVRKSARTQFSHDVRLTETIAKVAEKRTKKAVKQHKQELHEEKEFKRKECMKRVLLG